MSEYQDIPSLYGSSVFSDKEMRARLPREIYKRLAASMATGEELDPAVADATASAMKAWAIEQGATHYTHWFQPLTGTTAESTIPSSARRRTAASSWSCAARN